MISMDGSGFILKNPDGSYGDRMPWTKLAQADLKELEQNPKAAQWVEPFIEPDPNERMKRTEVEIKDYPKLAHPAGHSLAAALFTTPIGLLMILLLYAGNIYAAYEISLFRAQKPGLVCGVAAVAPVVGPIIFLSMPTNLKPKEQTWQTAAEQQVDPNLAAAIAAEEVATAEVATAEAAPGGLHVAHATAAPAVPQGKSYVRGQFTFNRRFFETQMPAFFAISRPEAEKDKILVVKASRGQYIAQRISRITANDMTLQVNKGHASEEVVIPFVEIQEVHIKHKDAP